MYCAHAMRPRKSRCTLYVYVYRRFGWATYCAWICRRLWLRVWARATRGTCSRFTRPRLRSMLASRAAPRRRDRAPRAPRRADEVSSVRSAWPRPSDRPGCPSPPVWPTPPPQVWYRPSHTNHTAGNRRCNAFSCRLGLAIVCKPDVVQSTGNT